MKKNNRPKGQKKRRTIILIIFLILLIPSLIGISDKAKELFASLSFGNKPSVEKESAIPAKLRWFDPFGDIDNLKHEK